MRFFASLRMTLALSPTDTNRVDTLVILSEAKNLMPLAVAV